MFTLRKITADGVEHNYVIGDDYNSVTRESNYDDFCKIFKDVFGRNHVADIDETADDDTKKCHAFIWNYKRTYPLYKGDFNFVMTDRGKTYANYSYRD
jgi:hypothetical protein